MTRRLAAVLLGLVAILSLVLGACASPPAAPALSDPKEIVAKGATSLTGVKTFEFTGTFSGNVQAAQLGSFDLSSVRLVGAVDAANKAAKLTLDAPSIMGTKVDAIVVGGKAYYKLAGAPALMAGGGSGDKYSVVDAPTGAADPNAGMTDPTKLVADLQTALSKLPVPPTKAADERCGDADCYHVTMSLDAAQLRQFGGAALGSAGVPDGALAVDLFTRKQDYRPAKIAFAVTSNDFGRFGFTLELRYDVGVSVQAPSADQIAP